ncbi:MAG: ABC transporter substrate-binding protein [Candidatus Malihini olakiniferum]
MACARHSDDFLWMEVELNPKATFHDGLPILASNVTFTFNMFIKQSIPQFRVIYKGVTVKTIGLRTVRLQMPGPDKERLLGLLKLPVMPESFWKNHSLADPLFYPPPASGPYRITSYRTDSYVTYKRVQTIGEPTCRLIAA